MKRALVLPAAAALLLSLSGCITIQLPPQTGTPQTDTPDAGDRQTENITCAGQQTLTLNQPDTDYVLDGTCHDVAIEGAGLTVAADTIRELAIRGDGNAVTLNGFSTLTINGQDNGVEVLDGGDAIINGNQNRLHSSNDLKAVNVSGQDNDVTADGFIASLDESEG